jgi:hypothetical protein
MAKMLAQLSWQTVIKLKSLFCEINRKLALGFLCPLASYVLF